MPAGAAKIQTKSKSPASAKDKPKKDAQSLANILRLVLPKTTATIDPANITFTTIFSKKPMEGKNIRMA